MDGHLPARPLSEVRLWARALDAADLGRAVPRDRVGLNAWWRINENEGQVLRDSVWGSHLRFSTAEWTTSPDAALSWLGLHIDGEPVATTTSDRTVDRDLQFTIGASKTAGTAEGHFRGVLDEVRVWGAARGAEQIRDHLFSRLDTSSDDLADLIAYYRFDRSEIDDAAQPTSVADSGPGGNHLPIEASTRPTEVLSTAPVSAEAALVRCALAGVKTSFHLTGISGRPAVTRFVEDDAVMRCFGWISNDRWHLTDGVRVAGDVVAAPVALDPGAVRGAGTVPTGNTLLVPMHLKGIYLSTPLKAAGPTVDFTYLPWNDGTRDHNPDYAPLGANLELPPMQNLGGELQAGVHLHWTLPPALGRPIDIGGRTVLPYIPVRWQIEQIEGGDDRRTLWSDHLHPPDTPINDAHVAIPVPPDPERSTDPPYRYMGVATEGDLPAEFSERMRDHYRDEGPDGVGDRHKLTILGYGDPTLTSYYPNGREILGHHVSTDRLGDDVSVSSWLVQATLYDPADSSSPLFELMADTGLSLEELLEALGWAENASGIESIQLIGAVEIEHTSKPHVPAVDSAVELAMGATGTEALSAHLARRFGAEFGDPIKIEEQLEAVLMGNKLHGHGADLGFRFGEARHEQGYQSHPGGTIWCLTDADDVPADVHTDLRELNRLQRTADKLENEVISVRGQLYADWCRYMLAKYPPPAGLEQFEEMDYPSVGAIAAWIESITAETAGRTTFQLADARAEVEDLSERLGGRLAEYGASLTQEPTDPFYSPNDPVILIAGLDLPHTPAAATLEPRRVDVFAPEARALWGAVDEAWDGELVGAGDEWMPFIMEWQAEFVPLVDGTSAAAATQRFTLHEDDADADLRDISGVPDPAPVYLEGRTFLTLGIGDRFQRSLAEFLTHWLPGGAELDQVVERARHYLLASQAPSDTDDAVLTACRAYVALSDETVVSQSLGGFHDGLLQRERHLQPAMSDPLGSPDEQAFTHAIAAFIGDEPRLAPNPGQPFLPLRAGSLRLTGLRLIDVWGRPKDIIRDRPIEPAFAETLRPFPHKPGWAGLRPRSVQPLRVRTEWLTESVDGDETAEGPPVSPVIGWIMANHMDRSLMVFDGTGVALGAFDRDGDFAPAPGTSRAAALELASGVPAALAHVGRHASGNPAWVRAFLDATDDALGRIAPRDHLHHPGLAVLAGRPLAVVRVRLSLELMGLPVRDQSWEHLTGQLAAHRAGQNTDHSRWEDMRLPVRLGSYRSLDDGLVGFWVEDAEGRHIGPLHSMASQVSGEILGHDDPSALLWLPVAGKPVTVTMLIDPRGSVHVATGVLPMKTIKLGLSEVQGPLQRLSSWYLQAPLLQPPVRSDPDPAFFAGPPHEPGMTWRWVEAATDHNVDGEAAIWREYRHFKSMRTSAHLEAASELREGWLVLDHGPDPSEELS